MPRTGSIRRRRASVDVGGTLYGTTSAGGALGGGTVFSITTNGVENVLHSFGAQGDGNAPVGGSLLEERGTLRHDVERRRVWQQQFQFQPRVSTLPYPPGCGTVFSITTGGTEKVLHSFGNGDDGQHPWAAWSTSAPAPRSRDDVLWRR